MSDDRNVLSVDDDAASPVAAPRPRAGTFLKFWGVRGSIPTPGPGTVQFGGNTSCVEIRADDQIIILDAGTGLRLLGRELIAESRRRPLQVTLLLTHTHWDHIQGLPFFLPLLEPHNHVRILGYEGARQGLDSVLTNQMDSPYFPIGLRQMAGNIHIEELKQMSFTIGPVKVCATFANHPGICVGYRLFTSSGSVAFFPDNEPYLGRHRVTTGVGPTDIMAFEHAREAHGKLVEFLQGTDALIMDTQYDNTEYHEHVGWGHGCLNDVVQIAIDANVRQLFLFHHDPDHDDDRISQMVAQARQLAAVRNAPLQIEAAREGLTVPLPVQSKP